jgi:polysaccharide pyruvyl transferase WcaK-like protein
MKILHLANWNSTNIGNGALIYGTERVISEDIPHVEFVAEAWDDYTFKRKKFDETFVELVNKHDALLVNGAVTFNAFRLQMKNTGTRFDLPLNLLDKIEKPIILYGLSYRCWPFQEYPNRKAFIGWLNYMISRENVFFGVRNDGTKEWLKRKFGVDSIKIHEVPDPALFVPVENHDYPELHPTYKNILIAFNNEDAPYRFASPLSMLLYKVGKHVIDPARLNRGMSRLGLYKKERSRTVRELAIATQEIIKKHEDVQFILVPHYLDDYDMLDEFINVVQERIAHQRIVSTGLVSVPHTPYFYGRYAKADLAISMRVHSMSPSIGLGIPVIPVTSQGRMRNFLKKANLEDIAVDVSADDFGKDIAVRANELLDNSEAFKEKTRVSVVEMRKQAREINEKVRRTLGL